MAYKPYFAPKTQIGTVIISDKKHKYLKKAYLKTRNLRYSDNSFDRFIQSTVYILAHKDMGGNARKPHIGLQLQMGHTNKILVVCQEFEGVVLAFEELAISLREQLDKVQSIQDREAKAYYTP
jgi:hypothetical protein